MIPSLEGWPTKTKEAPLHEVRLTLLATNPVFQCLGELTNVALETLLNKLFTLDRESNKQIINEHIRQRPFHFNFI